MKLIDIVKNRKEGNMMFKSKLKTRIAIWIILAVIVLNGVLPSFYNDVYAAWTKDELDELKTMDDIIMASFREQALRDGESVLSGNDDGKIRISIPPEIVSGKTLGFATLRSRYSTRYYYGWQRIFATNKN